MIIEQVKWDSDFFGIKIGKITVYDEADFDPNLFKQEAIDNNFNLIYIFKFQTLLSVKSVLNADLELMDIQLTMSKIFNSHEFLNKPFNFRTELSNNELKECYLISENTSSASRFYSEKLIGPNKTKELYRKWIDNAINKQYVDGILLFKNCNEIAGIHLIKTDEKSQTGFCSLIGVSPNSKGTGIGRNLWEQAFSYWAQKKSIEICKVPFSLQNAESFNFHLKMGFNKIEEIKYIYHYRNKIK